EKNEHIPLSHAQDVLWPKLRILVEVEHLGPDLVKMRRQIARDAVAYSATQYEDFPGWIANQPTDGLELPGRNGRVQRFQDLGNPRGIVRQEITAGRSAFLRHQVPGRALAFLELGDQLALEIVIAGETDLADKPRDRRRADACTGSKLLYLLQAGEGIVGKDCIGELALACRQPRRNLHDRRSNRHRRSRPLSAAGRSSAIILSEIN